MMQCKYESKCGKGTSLPWRAYRMKHLSNTWITLHQLVSTAKKEGYFYLVKVTSVAADHMHE